MKLLHALALMSLSLPAFADAPSNVDAPGKTMAGVEYTQPRDWSAQIRGPVTVFIAPEADLSIAVVDVGDAPDAQAAAAKAWSMYKPGAAPTLTLVTAAPPADGWNQRASIAYETSPNERVVRAALEIGRAHV